MLCHIKWGPSDQKIPNKQTKPISPIKDKPLHLQKPAVTHEDHGNSVTQKHSQQCRRSWGEWTQGLQGAAIYLTFPSPADSTLRKKSDHVRDYV